MKDADGSKTQMQYCRYMYEGHSTSSNGDRDVHCDGLHPHNYLDIVIVRFMIFMIMQPILTHMMVVMIYLFTISKENLDHTFKEVHFFFLFIAFPWFKSAQDYYISYSRQKREYLKVPSSYQHPQNLRYFSHPMNLAC